AWLPAERLQKEHAVVGFYLSAHPLDEYASLLKRMRVQTWAEFSESVRRGATAGRLAGTVTARQERRTRTGNRMAAVQLSDSTGSFEGVLFSDGLAQYRELLEPGRSVVVLVNAEDRPEGINIRIESVQAIEKQVANLKQIRVFLRDPAPLASLDRHLTAKGEGAISLILILDEGKREVEMKLPGSYAISPQIAGALRAVRGVEQVEMV
ncbi:MAG: DNA polymerase III subunit alpha, partial [Rhizobiales bacterium]|nr:DNA polymerase III subunit alpha [Hyphomicrobiales bacterium]